MALPPRPPSSLIDSGLMQGGPNEELPSVDIEIPQAEDFAGGAEVIDEVAAFPNGDHDDFVDSMTMALIRFRQGGFISLEGEDDMNDNWYPKQREYY